MWVIDVQASKIENNPVLCNFIHNIASWKNQQMETAEQRTSNYIFTYIEMCRIMYRL